MSSATEEQEQVELHPDVEDSLDRVRVLIQEAFHQVDLERAEADGDMDYLRKVLQRSRRWLGYLEYDLRNPVVDVQWPGGAKPAEEGD